MSGIGGEVCEVEELLETMREDREDLMESEREKSDAVAQLDAEEERLEAVIREQATSRVRTIRESDPGSSQDVMQRSGKRPYATIAHFVEKMEEFCATIKKGDDARLALEHERISFERERHAD